eukprot:974224-Rhodomonas_salina.2
MRASMRSMHCNTGRKLETAVSADSGCEKGYLKRAFQGACVQRRAEDWRWDAGGGVLLCLFGAVQRRSGCAANVVRTVSRIAYPGIKSSGTTCDTVVDSHYEFHNPLCTIELRLVCCGVIVKGIYLG